MSTIELPSAAGIGLRAPHVPEVLRERPRVAFFEVHSENYYVDGGTALAALERVRAGHALSLHGVGMSLGSVDPLDPAHVAKLARLVARVQPALVSEHLCWSGVDGRHLNDLLPLPFTREAVQVACERIDALQEALGRRIAIENVSAYLALPGEMPEWTFVAEVVRRSGCALLLDVNNVHVNAVNHGFDADEYIAALDPDVIVQIHLAGFERAGELLVDTHGAPVDPAVWALYARTLARIGPRPTLIEWDTSLPALPVLLDEARHAQSILEAAHAVAA